MNFEVQHSVYGPLHTTGMETTREHVRERAFQPAPLVHSRSTERMTVGDAEIC